MLRYVCKNISLPCHMQIRVYRKLAVFRLLVLACLLALFGPGLDPPRAGVLRLIVSFWGRSPAGTRLNLHTYVLIYLLTHLVQSVP